MKVTKIKYRYHKKNSFQLKSSLPPSKDKKAFLVAYPRLMKISRDKVRFEFIKLIGDKVPSEQIEKYFNYTFKSTSETYNRDIPVFTQALYMDKLLDTILDMECFLKIHGENLNLDN